MKKLLSFGPLFIVIAAFLWSLDGLLRQSLYVLPPITIVFYEHLVGFVFLLPFIFKHLPKLKTVKPKTWGAMMWVTVLSSILGTLFYTAALGMINYIQFSVVVLLQQTQPIFVMFFAWLVLKEKITPKFFIYAALALVGAYMVSFPTLTVNLATGQGTVIAALFAVAAAFCWGSSTSFSRYTLLQLPSLLTTGMRFGMAAIIGFIAVFLLNAQSSLLTLNQTQGITLVIIALSTGMVALAIYYYGLKRTPARIAAICELTWPVSAVAIDYFYFHKTLSPTQIIGAIILLFTIYSVSKLAKNKKEEPHITT